MWKKRAAAAVMAAVALMPAVGGATPPPPPPPAPVAVISDPIVWPVIEMLYGVMTRACTEVSSALCRR